MKRRFTCILIALLVACTQLWAIGFGYHVIEARGEMEFSSGIFPVSVDYQFNFPMPDFISGSSTVFAFRLDNGLDFRTLRQNPDDGSFYALTGADHPLDYMTIYDEFNLFFTQGFWDDHIGLTLAITGRFEHAYETLNFMIDGNDDGLFWDEAGNYRFAGSSFIGVPEFRGDRKVFQSYVSGGFSLDFLDEDIVTRDGMKFESFFRITGPWMPLNDGTANFFISSNDLDLAVTMFSLDRGNGKHWMSVVLDNSTTFRYAAGTKVPQYIMGGVVWDDVAILPGDLPLLKDDDWTIGLRYLSLCLPSRPEYESIPGNPVFVPRRIKKGLEMSSKPFKEYLNDEGICLYPASIGCIYDIDTPERYRDLLVGVRESRPGLPG